MQFPFNPQANRYQEDQNERPPRKQSSDSSLIKDFLTKPIPLPIWLWNLIVIAIYLSLLIFVIQWGLAIIVAIILFLTNL